MNTGISFSQTPTRKWSTLFLVGLSLSIGWGIRGNFGHEFGAAFAGCLAAIAIALLSGREDWQSKVGYFALFGAIGWGFGASMSYMQVIAYSESGHALSQWYGYCCLFIIGFLWAAIGSIGTAFPAVADKDQIVKLFTPLLFILAARLLLSLIEDPVAEWMASGIGFDGTWSRHKNPLYWFDAYYLPAFSALFGAGIYDLWQRKGNSDRMLLPLFATGGAMSGWLIQLGLKFLGWDKSFAGSLTYLQGDPTYINPQTGSPAYEAINLLNNWPQWFGDYPDHIGWVIGLIVGLTLYFFRYGKFRNGSFLFVYMAGGWLISFLIFPVLASNFFANYGGIRMTPPRSDDWAGIVGLFIGTLIWLWKNNLRAVAWASVVAGIIGGLGFSGIEWLKSFLRSFGNPNILEWKGIPPGSEAFTVTTSNWAAWQTQNWHSFLEQSYGFVNGIAIAVALGLLATRIKLQPAISFEGSFLKSGRWTNVISILLVLLALTYFNVVQNVKVWSEQLDQKVWTEVVEVNHNITTTIPAQWDLPLLGRLPGMHFLSLSPEGWFNVTWLMLVMGCVLIVRRHLKKPLNIIPSSHLGKGQLIFIILLWILTIANFERALTGWHPSRMLTEWTIFVNTIIATVLILILPTEEKFITINQPLNYSNVFKKSWMLTGIAIVLSSIIFTITNRLIYHYPDYNQLEFKSNTSHTRFGPNASWRTKPNLKNAEHK